MTKLSKYLSYVLYLLLAVTLVFAGLFYFGGEVEDAGYPLYTESFLNWGKVLLMIAAAVAILFEIANLLLHPQAAIRSLISIALLGVIVVIAYSMGDGTPLQLVGYKGPDNVPSMLILGDTFLYSTYILIGGALVAILFTEVSRIFK
ncbi:hypothetical protein BY457_11399 [Marinilabilia salmonicolor]|jgi:hypothetical protein|uniref:hypothetical protein n=1 Tax=Marinilabilia salmonicolor TaxID=989 RepID=UPI000D078E6B|nr:hypothetical protein [Marinilabilia salmonicolor]PRY97025.1 hypothetical protein BY457_11399 [Marinilabilia salmonicolor]